MPFSTDKKQLTHEECRKAVCFFCLRKGKLKPKISDSFADFISHGIFPEFPLKRQNLPDAYCSTCANKVYTFMKLERNEPDVFVNKVHNSRYVEISNELEALPEVNLDCTCTICKIARSNPLSKGKSEEASATATQPGPNTPDLLHEPLGHQNDDAPTVHAIPDIPMADALPDNQPENAGAKIKRPLPNIPDNLAPFCTDCYKFTGRGFPHDCTRTARVDNLQQQLSPATLQRLANLTIRNQAKSGKVVLQTGGPPRTVTTEAFKSVVATDHDYFLDIQTDNPQISNKTLKRLSAGHRRKFGRNSILPGLRDTVVESGNVCKDWFQMDLPIFEKRVKKKDEDESYETVEVASPLVFCSDLNGFVDYIKGMREVGETPRVLHFGLDGGGGSCKVTLSITEPQKENNLPPSNKRAAKKDNGSAEKKSKPSAAATNQPVIDASSASDSDKDDPDYVPIFSLKPPKRPLSPKPETSGTNNSKAKSRYLDTGVKRLFIIASAPDVGESYLNLKKIFEALGIFEGDEPLQLGEGAWLHTDMSAWNKILGLQGHKSTHPCQWCESKSNHCSETGNWEKGATRRTLGRMRRLAKQFQDDTEKWEGMKARGVKSIKKPEAKNYFNCVLEPLIKGNDEKCIYEVCPLPELHLLTGITSHIFNELNDAWGEDKAYQWALTHNIPNDSHHGNGFKGNSARRVLSHAGDLELDVTLPRRLKIFAHALQAFNIVVAGSFGKYESKFIIKEIYDFETAFMKLNISVTPKVHAVFEHLPEFLNLGYGPLGYYSEQATEASHYDFTPVWNNYGSNPTKIEQVGMQHLHAMNKYNSLHVGKKR